ncbi:hypothetical protein [Leisingera sp. ANG-S5]|uniref:hypothetical protein n=1 Tax=Leisingera sp. ANG-S5 TaxID=1577901 RepID=UPI00126A1828|nr:hypothetical protein [Leisingera sp. ANG-S5]
MFDNETRGAKSSSSTVSWDLDLFDGSNLCSPCHASLLDWLKRLVWSAFAAPGDGAGRLKPGSLGTLATGLRYFVNWCVENDVTLPSQMTRNVTKAYVDHLRTEANGGDEGQSLTEAVAWNRLRVLAMIWQQRHALKRVGIAPMPDPPFGRLGVCAVVKEIGAVASGTYRPIPSEVSLRILNTAMKLLNVPAKDVIRLGDLCASAYATNDLEGYSESHRKMTGKKRQRDAALGFQFSLVDGRPWHPSLDSATWDQKKIHGLRKKLTAYLAGVKELPAFSVGSRMYVDTRKVVLSIGHQAGMEYFLHTCPHMNKALSERARLEGLSCPLNSPAGRLLQLTKAICSAAHIVVQGTIGLRISEVCGLKAGVCESTGLPRCIHVRDSVTGLAEVFVLTTELSKTEESPRAEEWAIGYRPKGSSRIPPAVHAILVLNRLLEPYRELLAIDDLFVNLNGRRSLPKSRAGVGRVTSERLQADMRAFIAEWVDLSDLPDEAAQKTMDRELVPWRESHGRILKTHQWRKSFAHFVYMVDPMMLPVLQAHFHHVSIAMTDGGYLNNVIQIEDMNDIKRQKVASLALEIARGGSELAGRNGEDLQEKILRELGPEIEGESTEAAYQSAFIYVEEAGLHRMFFEPYGICGAKSASEMACHKEAGTEDLARWRPDLVPNYSTRTPNLCAGCPSFAIARWNLPFWEERYVESVFAVRQYEVVKMDMTYMDRPNELMRARAKQSAALCRKLGADISELDLRVETKLEELRHAS